MNVKDIKSILSEKTKQAIEERKLVVKVNSKGQRRKKVVCGSGMKYDGSKCVRISASEKLNRKKGARFAKISKAGDKAKISRKSKIAKKKRKSQGL